MRIRGRNRQLIIDSCSHAIFLLLLLFCCRQYAPQNLRNTPRLGNTPSCDIGRFGIAYFTESANTSSAQCFRNPFRSVPHLFVIWTEASPRINEMTNEPRPDCPLMIGGISGTEVAIIPRAENPYDLAPECVSREG